MVLTVFKMAYTSIEPRIPNYMNYKMSTIKRLLEKNCYMNYLSYPSLKTVHVPLKQKDAPVELFKALTHRSGISNKFLSEENQRNYSKHRNLCASLL